MTNARLMPTLEQGNRWLKRAGLEISLRRPSLDERLSVKATHLAVITHSRE